MPGNRFNTLNVLVGASTLWVAPAGTAMVADSLAVDSDWGGAVSGWRCPGATDKGVTVTHKVNTSSEYIDEQVTEVARTLTTGEFTFDASLAEDTVENMQLAYGRGSITVVAPGAGQPGTKTLALTDTLTPLAFGLEGKNPAGFWRRIYVPSGFSSASPKTTYSRSSTKRMYDLTLSAACASSLIIVRDMTAVATS